jgi:hypothetical protein
MKYLMKKEIKNQNVSLWNRIQGGGDSILLQNTVFFVILYKTNMIKILKSNL